jgi:hypothetical protein
VWLLGVPIVPAIGTTGMLFVRRGGIKQDLTTPTGEAPAGVLSHQSDYRWWITRSLKTVAGAALFSP